MYKPACESVVATELNEQMEELSAAFSFPPNTDMLSTASRAWGRGQQVYRLSVE